MIFAGPLARVGKQDEILEQVHEPPFVADDLQQGFHRQPSVPLVAFIELQPFCIMLKVGADRTKPSLFAIGEDDKGVEMEEMGDCILVVGQIFGIGAAQILVGAFELAEQQRQPIDEAHNVGSPPMGIPTDPKLPNTEKIVILRRLKIEHAQMFHLLLAILAELHLHPVTDQGVFLLIDPDEGLGAEDLGDLLLGYFVGLVWQTGIEGHQRF